MIPRGTVLSGSNMMTYLVLRPCNAPQTKVLFGKEYSLCIYIYILYVRIYEYHIFGHNVAAYRNYPKCCNAHTISQRSMGDQTDSLNIVTCCLAKKKGASPYFYLSRNQIDFKNWVIFDDFLPLHWMLKPVKTSKDT